MACRMLLVAALAGRAAKLAVEPSLPVVVVTGLADGDVPSGNGPYDRLPEPYNDRPVYRARGRFFGDGVEDGAEAWHLFSGGLGDDGDDAPPGWVLAFCGGPGQLPQVPTQGQVYLNRGRGPADALDQPWEQVVAEDLLPTSPGLQYGRTPAKRVLRAPSPLLAQTSLWSRTDVSVVVGPEAPLPRPPCPQCPVLVGAPLGLWGRFELHKLGGDDGAFRLVRRLASGEPAVEAPLFLYQLGTRWAIGLRRGSRRAQLFHLEEGASRPEDLDGAWLRAPYAQGFQPAQSASRWPDFALTSAFEPELALAFRPGGRLERRLATLEQAVLSMPHQVFSWRFDVLDIHHHGRPVFRHGQRLLYFVPASAYDTGLWPSWVMGPVLGAPEYATASASCAPQFRRGARVIVAAPQELRCEQADAQFEAACPKGCFWQDHGCLSRAPGTVEGGAEHGAGVYTVRVAGEQGLRAFDKRQLLLEGYAIDPCLEPPATGWRAADERKRAPDTYELAWTPDPNARDKCRGRIVDGSCHCTDAAQTGRWCDLVRPPLPRGSVLVPAGVHHDSDERRGWLAEGSLRLCHKPPKPRAGRVRRSELKTDVALLHKAMDRDQLVVSPGHGTQAVPIRADTGVAVSDGTLQLSRLHASTENVWRVEERWEKDGATLEVGAAVSILGFARGELADGTEYRGGALPSGARVPHVRTFCSTATCPAGQVCIVRVVPTARRGSAVRALTAARPLLCTGEAACEPEGGAWQQWQGGADLPHFVPEEHEEVAEVSTPAPARGAAALVLAGAWLA